MRLSEQIAQLDEQLAALNKKSEAERERLNSRVQELAYQRDATTHDHGLSLQALAEGTVEAEVCALLELKTRALDAALGIAERRVAAFQQQAVAEREDIARQKNTLAVKLGPLHEARKQIERFAPNDVAIKEFLDRAVVTSEGDFLEALLFLVGCGSGAHDFQLWIKRYLGDLPAFVHPVIATALQAKAA